MKLFAFAALLAGTCFSTSGPAGPGEADPRDVRGNYDVTYDDHLRLVLNIGGADRVVTQDGYGGIADFGTFNGQPVTLDLTQFCARPDVVCPSEQFWSKVSIDQPDLSKNTFDLQTVTVIDNVSHDLDAGQRAPNVSGLVDHSNEDNFVLGLGAQAAGNQSCVAFDISLANGRFTHTGEHEETDTVYRDETGHACNTDAGTPDAGAVDAGLLPDGGMHTCTASQVQNLVFPKGAKVDGIAEGNIGLAWAGGCAFGPILVGATFTLETGYTAKRTGDFDPPPYTPAPVVLPDGGTDAGFP